MVFCAVSTFAACALQSNHGAAEALPALGYDRDARGHSRSVKARAVLPSGGRKVRQEPPMIDVATYQSVSDDTKQLTVTDTLNKLLETNPVNNITGGLSLNEMFGDVAYDEWKKIVVTKGDESVEIYENTDGNEYDISSLFPEDLQKVDTRTLVRMGSQKTSEKDMAEKANASSSSEVSESTSAELAADMAAVQQEQKDIIALERQAYEESLKEESAFFVNGQYQCPSAITYADGRARYALTMDEFKYAKCPPGVFDTPMANRTYMLTKMKNRMHRLRSAICASKAKGWRSGNAHEGDFYKTTGYATFESGIWPKRKKCNEVIDEEWANENKIGKRYRPDVPPRWMSKMVNREANLEFRSIWKVASTAFPEYLRCRFSTPWELTPALNPATPGRPVAVAVRNPIARFVSAAGELLQRAVNHWCPNGPCDTKDGFDVNATLDKLAHQTSWFQLFKDQENVTFDKELLHLVVRAMVSDTGCNYYTYAAEHLSTQTSFIAQNAGAATPVSVLLKLSEDDAPPSNMNRLWMASSTRTRTIGKQGLKCSLQKRNVQTEKPNGDKVPRSSEFFEVLRDDSFLLRDLCLIYAQDYVCFNFALPDACKGMF